jgi:hypothetical protein
MSFYLSTKLSINLLFYLSFLLSVYLSMHLSSKLHVSTSQFICNCTNTEAVPRRMRTQEAGQTGIFRFLGCEANYLSPAVQPIQQFNIIMVICLT